MIYSKTNSKIEQPQSALIKLGIHSQKIPYLGSMLSGKLTQYCGRFKEKKNSLERIQKFAKTYNIQPKFIRDCKGTTTDEECWNKFESLNDFFIRHRIDLPTVRNIQTLIVSPADCYSVFLTDPKVWIKGTQFTTSKLMTGNEKPILSLNLNLIIFRLAPHHYHRFHCPVYGKITKLTVFGTKYNSVDPIIVHSFKNVYTSNVRIVVEIQTRIFGKLYLAIIGATCVGSIVLNHPDLLKKLKRTEPITDADIRKNRFVFREEYAPIIRVNEELGFFQYGGSTLVLGYSSEHTQLVDIGKILEQHTSQMAETEIEVGDELVKFKR